MTLAAGSVAKFGKSCRYVAKQVSTAAIPTRLGTDRGQVSTDHTHQAGDGQRSGQHRPYPPGWGRTEVRSAQRPYQPGCEGTGQSKRGVFAEGRKYN